MSSSGMIVLITAAFAADPAPRFDADVAPLFKRHCVKCHGPVTAEARLNLSTPAGVLRGGENGAVIQPHDLKASPLWRRVEADEMPPEEPLSADEKALLRTWIERGAPGLPTAAELAATGGGHWAFQKLSPQAIPAVKDFTRVRSPLDQFIQADLEHDGLTLSPDADRHTLIRRMSYDLIGLPPTPIEIEEFLADAAPDAAERLADRYLASPHYGERLGKVWLDAAGYADSNGYFNADSDRPLAFRYRDYVIRALNSDKPFDRFVQEQLAGDELVGWTPDLPVTPEIFDALTATHFLRNGQDGTGESDGNDDEVRADRYYTIEGTMQITASSLLGLTIQCAKCHSHKFEPIPHEEYYQFQAVFAGVFHHQNWMKPNDRFVIAPLPQEQAEWEQKVAAADEHAKQARRELATWVNAHRPQGKILFQDTFDGSQELLAERWSPHAPGDDAPAGETAIAIDSDTPPGVRIKHGEMQILENGLGGNRWVVTKQRFDWTPDVVGSSIQVTFDLVSRRVDPNGTPSIRHGFYIAAHDLNDNGPAAGGNLLIDGNPGSSSTVYLDYPGPDQQPLSAIGVTPYSDGRNYGVRVTHQPEGKFLLEHLVDGLPEEKTLTLTAEQLPDGAFGYECCCGRSYIVDNVVVESFDASQSQEAIAEFMKQVQPLQKASAEAAKKVAELRDRPPGKIAWGSDLTPNPPAVQWLNRGDYGSPKEPVNAGPFSALTDAEYPWPTPSASENSRTTGRRLAWATWVTQPDSRPASLVARVETNRIWQHHFGFGIVATSDNFGLSGSPPTHPALLDWLAGEFVYSGWSIKSLHRRIIGSQAYRQTSRVAPEKLAADPDGRRYSRAPVRRLDAEAIRDTLLQLSGGLNDQVYGPYIKTNRTGNGEVIVPEGELDSGRRSVYLNQRRTQVVSMLQIFDAPTIVFNSIRRTPTTVPLQSLNLLNSEFVVNRISEFTERLAADQSDDSRLQAAFLQLWGRTPTADEISAAKEFLAAQIAERGGTSDAVRQAWLDLHQMLFAASAALYLE